MACPSVHVMLQLLPRWRRHSRRCITQWPRGSAALSRPRRAPGGGGERGAEAAASQWCGCAAQPGSPRCGQRRWGDGVGWGFWEFRLIILRWEWNMTHMTHKSQEIQILDDWLTPLKRMIFYGRARPELKARLVQNRAPWLHGVNQVWNGTMLHPIVSSGGLSFQNNKFKQRKAWLPQKIIGSHVWLFYILYYH